MGALLYTRFIGTEDGTCGMGWLIYSRPSVWGKRFRVTVLPFYHASVGLGKPRITYCLEHFSYAITLTTALYYEWTYDALCALSYHKAFAQFAYCGWLEHISFISWKTTIRGLADLHKQWVSQPLATFVCHFLSFTGWLQVPQTYVPTARKSTKWKTM